jgi:hypothetical protein
MSAPRKYDQEFRERAVRMYGERLEETAEPKRNVRRHVGALLDVNPERSRNWVEERDRVSRDPVRQPGRRSRRRFGRCAVGWRSWSGRMRF